MFVIRPSKLRKLLKKRWDCICPGPREERVNNLLERILTHLTFNYLQSEVAEQLNSSHVEGGKNNFVVKLLDRNTFYDLHKNAAKRFNNGDYKINPEGTLYSTIIKLSSLEEFITEFEPFAFTYSYKEDRELFKEKNGKEYCDVVDFNLLFKGCTVNKLKESVSLYRKISYHLAKELARNAAEELDVDLNKTPALEGLQKYISKYRGSFAERAYVKLEELIRDGSARESFFFHKLPYPASCDDQIRETVYESYHKVLTFIYSHFDEFLDYINLSTPLFEDMLNKKQPKGLTHYIAYFFKRVFLDD